MSTELLFTIILTALLLTGVDVTVAIGYALLTWCTIEAIAEQAPRHFKAAWALGSLRIAVQVGAA